MRDERGVTAVLFAALLPLMLIVCALVVDVGYWYVADRRAQSAADAGALAAAQVLPNFAKAEADGAIYAGSNLPGLDATSEPRHVSTVVETNYNGDPTKVEVTVKLEASTFFGRILGLDSVDIGARAVAERAGADVPLVIFTKDTDCEFGLKINGNAIDIGGAIHSNGKLEANGNNIDVGGGAAGGPNRCNPTIDGKHITFGDGTQPTAHTADAPWPREYELEDYWPASPPRKCTYGPRQKFEFNTNNETIPEGVYCATESFIANANHLKGRITVFAPEIVLNGNHQIFEPYIDDLLLYATGDKELKINANAHELTGIIFHPGGRVVLDGNTGSIIHGMVEAKEFLLNGNAWDFDGSGNATEYVFSLVE